MAVHLAAQPGAGQHHQDWTPTLQLHLPADALHGAGHMLLCSCTIQGMQRDSFE